MTGASIREVAPAWADVLAAIHAAAFPPDEAWSAEAFRLQLGMPGVVALLHAEGGMILARQAADEAEILTVAVAPDVRRRGIGRLLLSAAVQRLASGGAGAIFLEVSARNEAATALYAGFGFEEVGLRRHYYVDGADARVLRLTVAPPSP